MHTANIETLIREIVRDELARSAPFSQPETYSSAGPLPKGFKRRRFLERVRTMPDAVRVGGKRGRGIVWSISRAAWEAAPVATSPESSNVVSIDALISASGYRATRSGR